MAIEQARTDLARLQAEIKRLETQLVSARERAEKVAHYIEMAELYSSGTGVVASVTRTRGGKSAAAAEIVAEILSQRGHPIKTRELLEELRARGVTFDTPNPVTNLSSALSRSPLLIGSRAEGWSLREWKDDPSVSHAESTNDDIWTVPARSPTGVLELDDDIPF